MSKKRREKTKAKAARHASDKKQQSAGAEAADTTSLPRTTGAASTQEMRFLRSSSHLQATSPEWQPFYLGIRNAWKELDES